MKITWTQFKKILSFYLLSSYSQGLFSETILLRKSVKRKNRKSDKLSMVFEEKDAKEPEVFSKKEILKVSYKDLTQNEINQLLKESGSAQVVDVSPGAPVL